MKNDATFPKLWTLSSPIFSNIAINNGTKIKITNTNPNKKYFGSIFYLLFIIYFEINIKLVNIKKMGLIDKITKIFLDNTLRWIIVAAVIILNFITYFQNPTKFDRL